MKIEVFSGGIEPGDLILVGSGYGQELGFYRGTGRGTIQYYTIRYLSHKLRDPKVQWAVSYMGGHYGPKRVSKYDPELVTEAKERKTLEEALEYIRQSNILPVKY